MYSSTTGEYVWLQDDLGNYRIRRVEDMPEWEYEVPEENWVDIPVLNRPDYDKNDGSVVALTAKEKLYHNSHLSRYGCTTCRRSKTYS
jgi:hypothetical protein